MRTIYPEGFYKFKSTDKMDETRKKLIDRVMKLLALADGTNHKEESDSARKMAVELMAKHNIRLSEAGKNDREFVAIKEMFGSRQMNHTTLLYNAVADFNGVLMLTGMSNRHSQKHFKYIGTRSALEAFKYMLDVVLQQRDRNWETFASSHLRHTSTKQQWLLGFAIGVGSKCEEIKSASCQQVQEWGLVPVDEANQALAWYKKNNKVQNCKVGVNNYSPHGFSSGRSVNLHKGVSAQDGVKNLGY